MEQIRNRIKPNREHFSHPSFSRYIKSSTLRKMKNLKRAYGSFLDTYTKRCRIRDLIYKNEIKYLDRKDGYKICNAMYKIVENIDIVLKNKRSVLNQSGKKNREFQDTCLLCDENMVLDCCHIIERDYFKKYPKKAKELGEFEYHIINIFYLCPTHHSYFDVRHGESLTPKQLNILKRHKKKEVGRIDRDCDKEIELIRKTEKVLNKKEMDNKEIRKVSNEWRDYVCCTNWEE